MSSRFDWVTSGLERGPHPICDRNLHDHPLAAVLPSLGSLVPGWLLVVPRVEALTIRDLPAHERAELLSLARAMAGAGMGIQPYVFEHGPSKASTSMGCGVDQAHLHTVGLNRDLLSAALHDDSVTWMTAS